MVSWDPAKHPHGVHGHWASAGAGHRSVSRTSVDREPRDRGAAAVRARTETSARKRYEHVTKEHVESGLRRAGRMQRLSTKRVGSGKAVVARGYKTYTTDDGWQRSYGKKLRTQNLAGKKGSSGRALRRARDLMTAKTEYVGRRRASE